MFPALSKAHSLQVTGRPKYLARPGLSSRNPRGSARVLWDEKHDAFQVKHFGSCAVRLACQGLKTRLGLSPVHNKIFSTVSW